MEAVIAETSCGQFVEDGRQHGAAIGAGRAEAHVIKKYNDHVRGSRLSFGKFDSWCLLPGSEMGKKEIAHEK